MEADAIELRVLGCLIEKQHTTPDAYPLSLNSLRLAANQSTNRDPVMQLDESQIRDALQRLYHKRWTRTQRTGRHAHQRLVAGMMFNSHISLSNRVRRRFSASRTRDFTVPSGMPNSRAISACGFSAKNESLTMAA